MDSKNPIATMIIFLSLLFAPPGWANGDLNKDKIKGLLEVLRDKGTITQEEYKSLKKKKKERIKKGLQFESAGGEFKFHVGGRLFVDSALYDDDMRTMGSGAELRAGRIFISGRIYKHWTFKGQYDFAANKVSVKDAFIGYSGFESAVIKVGQFKEPFSLEELTSSKFNPFMERGLPNVFSPGRNIGAGIITHGDNWTLAAGVFGEGVGVAPADNEGYGFSGRATFAPLHKMTRAVHIGFSAAFRAPDDGSDSIRYRQRPESHITGVRLVDTLVIGQVNHTLNFAAEGAVVFGRISLQGEYIWSRVNRMTPFMDLDFDGFYIFGSWFITGESRFYSAKNGVFSRVKPKHNLGEGGWGALEAAVRYSHLDLTDGPVMGGEEGNVTVGLNWYVNPKVRFMANFIWVDTDQAAGNDDPKVFQMRAQIDF